MPDVASVCKAIGTLPVAGGAVSVGPWPVAGGP